MRIRVARGEHTMLRCEQIAHVHGQGRHSTIYLWPSCNKNPIACAMGMAEMEALLRPLGHIRCHRSYMVNPAALQWLCGREIALPHGEATPVSPRRVRLHCKGRALPAPILYARLYDGLCLIAPQGGPLYASRTTLRQLQAKHPHLLPLNRWAVANPSAITNIELQPRPVAIMANGVRLNTSGRRQATCPTKTQVSIDLIINTLNIIASRFICKCLTDNTLTQQTSSPHPNFPNIRDRFQEKHEKNFSPRNP